MEIELKFQLPESKKKSVLQILNKQKAQKIQLQAKYYDTADRLLALLKKYKPIELPATCNRRLVILRCSVR